MDGSSSGSISAISAVFDPVFKLREEIIKYREKKKTQSRLLSALEFEAKEYIDAFEQMSDFGEEQIKPVLLAIKAALTTAQMNELAELASRVPLMSIKLLVAFVNLAKACSEVTGIEGFMKSLERANLSQFDFVKRMAAIYVPEDSVRINGTFFRYFRTYQDAFPRFNEKKTRKEIDDIGESMRYVKKWVAHARTRTPRLERKVLKRYVKNMKQFGKFSVKVKIGYSGTMNLQEYMPPSMKSLVAIIEEVF